LLVIAACAVPHRPPIERPSVSACVPAGRWIDPATGSAVALPDVVQRAVTARIVLLGEDHDRVAQHRWQLHTAAAIAGATSRLTLGFEMFPRRAQPVLDRWVDGELDEPAFLAETDWKRVWGFDPELYLPLFRFARMHRVPMRALNVDRALVHRVAAEGFAAVPADAREGLSAPAPPSPAYRARLAEAWHAHRPADAPADDAGLDRFVEAQVVWDHAMAAAIASALAERPGTVVVAAVGRGHVEHGEGIPAQLVAAGSPRPLVLVPWEAGRSCDELVPGVADLVFGLDAPAPPADKSDDG
jgi:uncharacterized iron-regulated protein